MKSTKRISYGENGLRIRKTTDLITKNNRMGQVRYYIIVHTENNIPIKVVYTTRDGVVVAEKSIDDSYLVGVGEYELGVSEYYVEHNKLGVFLYVKETSKKRLVKNRTWIQDFKSEYGPTDYKPKTTIKYLNI